MNGIKTQIEKEIKDANQDIDIVPGLKHNYRKVINRNYNYYHSNFESGEFDSQGFKKYFFNINRNPCNVSTKAIDFDTKDIVFQTAPGGDYLQTWFFERDLRFWFKDIGFGSVLNRIFEELPKFGTSVIKLIANKIYFVDLRNFIVDPYADTLEKAGYIIETHKYNLLEFEKIAEKQEWCEEGVAKLKADLKKNKSFIRVFERYGLNENNKLSRIIIGEARNESDEMYKKSEEKITNGVELENEEIEKIPYWEFHWEKIPGRWLGIGRVEILYDPQIRMNEITNLKVLSSYWTSLRLFQSRDEGIQRNLLTGTRTGDILNVKSEITPVATEERNLHAYIQEESRWLGNRDEMTVVFDVIRGERLPAGTPLGAAQIAAGMAGAYFDIIRENIAMAVKEFLFNGVIPQFQKEATKEHILNLVGTEDELVKLDKLIVNLTIRKRLTNLIKQGIFPQKEHLETLRQGVIEYLKNKKIRAIKIPAKFYENIKYKIDIVITGEQRDVRVQAANFFAALQAITADPTLLTDPMKKKFFFKWMEKGGLSPTDFEISETPQDVESFVQAKAAGGGISKPVIPQIPIGGEMERKV